jgi:hypothetical protein
MPPVDLQSLFDYSTFSNYGSDVDKEIEAEVFLTVLTPNKSVAYYRDMGTIAQRSLSRPLNFGQELKIKNQLVESLQTYNNNADDTQERRIAVPAESVKLIDTNKQAGDLDVNFDYYSLRTLTLKPVAA